MRVSEQVLLSVLRQGGRTAEPSQRGLVSFIQCVVKPRSSGRGRCQTGLKLKPEMTPGEKP